MDDVSSVGSSDQLLYSPSFISGVKDGDGGERKLSDNRSEEEGNGREEEAIFFDDRIGLSCPINKGVKIVSTFKNFS